MNKKITKAVIPVAGLGTRMLPATKAIPKEMLPIVDKPLIQYIINECAAAGIKEIVLVTHSSKNAIENHFDTSYELESILEKRVKRQLLSEVRSICPKDMVIMHVRQGVAKGLGHAILCAKPIIGDEAFAILLPDVLLDEYSANQNTDNLAAMIKRYEDNQTSQIMIEPVPMENVSKYGIVGCESNDLSAGQSAKITSMVEKPSKELAPSNLAIVGRYVLSPSIWGLLSKTPVGAGDEIQLTDALSMLVEKESVEAFHMQGIFHDCGDKLGYAKAFFDYAIKNEEFGKEFGEYVGDYLINIKNKSSNANS